MPRSGTSPTASGGSVGSGRGPLMGGRFFITFRLANHPGHRETVKICRRRESAGSLDYNSSTSWGSIAFPAEDVIDTDYFYSVDSNTSRIKVKVAGRYQIDYHLQADYSSGNSANPTFRVRRNGANNIGGGFASMYATSLQHLRGYTSCMTVKDDVAADDYFEIQSDRDGSSGTAVLASVKHRSIFEVRLLRADETPSSRQVAQFDGVVDKVVLMKGVAGTTGQTDVDLLKNGSTILNTNPMYMGWSDDVREFGPWYLSDRTVRAGDEFTLSVDANETPFMQDLTVQIWCRKL